MDEGMPKPSRREFIADAATLAAGAVLPGEANAGILYDWLGIGPNPEKVKELKNPYYMSRKYMAHKDGKLQANFDTLAAIGAKMKSERKYLDLPQDERDKEINALKRPIDEQKNAYLREFDPELIRELLLEYVQNGFTKASQPLLSIYERAGGNLEHIHKEGRAAFTRKASEAAIENISSVMLYEIKTRPTPDYGKVYHSALTFVSHEAPKDH